jgi:hypothetical protein
MIWGALMRTAVAADNGEEPPTGGFVADGPSVNADGTDGQTPALALPAGADEPWVAFAQNNRVLVSRFISPTAEWVQQDGALNRSLANVARNPALAFGGTDGNLAWAAWSEVVSSTSQLNAAWFNGAAWVLTSVLNHDAAGSADSPALATATLGGGTEALPWVVWSEAASGETRSIVASRAVVDGGAQGGYRWQMVGDPAKLDPARHATSPDLVFAGANQETPWIVWQETGGEKPERIFAARLVSESWQRVGRQENCGSNELACTLNLNPQRNAQRPQLAAAPGGLPLPNETVPSPWVVFAEEHPGGADIRVMRLDVGEVGEPADDRFVPVGGSVNQQCLGQSQLPAQEGRQPALHFVGNVPHVAWVERVGAIDQVFVCHLADARPGQERWDLNGAGGLNRSVGAAIAAPSLSADGMTPYVAWQEGEGPASIFVAHRYPEGAAWGRNYPPYIRIISPSLALADDFSAMPEIFADGVAARIAADGEVEQRVGPATITTTCYHAEGWEHIEEIQFTLTDASQRIFFARYVVSENSVYVEDPEDPGVFLPGVTVGPGSPAITTRYVRLVTSQMSVVNHGIGSAALDINWVLAFDDETLFQQYTQSLNILYDNGQATGFFQVGSVFVGQSTFLSIIAN